MRWWSDTLQRREWLAPVLSQIVPCRVAALDERNLFRPRPVLDHLLTANGIADILKFLPVHQPIDSVFLRETFYFASLVLLHAPEQIIGDPRVMRRDLLESM